MMVFRNRECRLTVSILVRHVMKHKQSRWHLQIPAASCRQEMLCQCRNDGLPVQVFWRAQFAGFRWQVIAPSKDLFRLLVADVPGPSWACW